MLSSVYEKSTVCVPSGRKNVALRLKQFDLHEVRMAEFTISRAGLRMSEHPYFTVCIARGGSVRSSVGGEAVVTQGRQCIVASPGGPIDVDYLTDNCGVLIVRFDRALMERELTAILGRTLTRPLKFALSPSLATLTPFSEAVQLLRRDVENQIFTGHRLLADRLFRLAACGLLVSAPHNYRDEMLAPSGFTGPKAIRTAAQLLDSDPLAYSTVGHLAAAVCLSVSALEDGFKRHIGTTPLKYQRLVRLSRAHEELANADGYDVTATTIAFRWGYTNYGRFASEHRRVYGRTPLEELRHRNPSAPY